MQLLVWVNISFIFVRVDFGHAHNIGRDFQDDLCDNSWHFMVNKTFCNPLLVPCVDVS